jgi:hypothetical protein
MSGLGNDVTNGSGRRRRRRPGIVAILVAIVGLIAAGGLGVLGYTASEDRTNTQAALNGQLAELASTQAELDRTRGDLADEKVSLADAEAKHEELTAEEDRLDEVVAGQRECIDGQLDAVEDQQGLSAEQTFMFNLSARRSKWAKAANAEGRALTKAIQYYVNAIVALAEGRSGDASSWLNQAREQLKIRDRQVKIQKDELARQRDLGAEIQAALGDLETQLQGTERTCEEAADGA